MKIIRCIAARLVVLLLPFQLFAQSPGQIVRPIGAGVTSLNPDGNGYSSATTAGFSVNDIAESELAFRVVPPAVVEPTGDLATGPTGGFSDIVQRTDGSGFYIYKDATNIYFRLRIGSIINGSKGYSVLIDTDGKMGSSDPNYVAPAGNSPGNPGFEYEVVLETNFQVAVYNIDGTATPGSPTVFALATHSQISVALSTDSNNPDYFYDWFVPLSAIGSPSSVRLAITTVVSPSSALQGSRSDIYGIDDSKFTSTSAAWQTVVNAQAPINLSSFGTIDPVCTSAPAITGGITAGSSVAVGGTWNRLDASKPGTATISLYKNGVLAGTTSATTGSPWSIVVPTISNGDIFYAVAQASGESQCLQSNSVAAKSCTTPPASPVLTCASLKGISGTMPTTASGNTVAVYLVPSTTASPLSNQLSTGANLTHPDVTKFAYYTDGCSGGTNNVATGTYMIVTQNGTCVSAPVFVCVSSGSSGTPPPISTNTLSLTQPIYAFHTTLSGTGALSGDILRLFINGKYQTSITATGSSFSFTGLTLAVGDQIRIYSQSGSACITQSNLFTVNCFLEAPAISVNTAGNLIAGATVISGRSSVSGGSVQLYKGTSPSGVAVGSAATTGSSGAWSVTVPALISGESYYATLTSGGCTSASSSSASVLTAAVCPQITGSYTDASTAVAGTMPSAFTGTIRLYLDGALIGTQSISAATSWNIPVSANTLYYNGSIQAKAQSAGGTESTGCTSLTIGCTSPTTPSVSPLSSTIAPGQNVTYSISSPSPGIWYSVSDNTGVSYATSAYNTGTISFDLPTNNFTSSGTYNLKISADALTGCPATSRAVTVSVNMTLPLVLLNFSGNYQDNRSVFNWSVTDAVNLSHFELEKSEDGRNFITAGEVPYRDNGTNVRNFEYTLQERLTKITYFRLRIVDADGTYKYSRSISLSPGAMTTIAVSAAPNPFTDVLNISYTSDKKASIRFVVTNMAGRGLISVERSVNKGSNSLSINEVNQLAPGFYLLTVINPENGDKTTLKLQKNK